MRKYRVLLLGPDGNVASRIDLNCEDEEIAHEQARELSNDGDAELWQGSRLIVKYPLRQCPFRSLYVQN